MPRAAPGSRHGGTQRQEGVSILFPSAGAGLAEVAAKLRKEGCEVFFDRASLKSENFDDRIRKEVEDCDLFVAYISQDSMEST